MTTADFGEARALGAETLELLKTNDPRLANLSISWDTEGGFDDEELDYGEAHREHDIMEFDFAHRVDWSNAGPLLAANTHLKKLSITDYTWMGIEYSGADIYDRCKKAWAQFREGVSRNRSIEHLRIYGITSVVARSLVESLSHLLEHNSNLRCLELSFILNASENLSVLTAALKQCAGSSSLEQLLIFNIEGMCGHCAVCRMSEEVDDEKSTCKLVEALRGYQNMSTLTLNACNIGADGCWSLRTLLQRKDCNIVDLSLESNVIDNKCIGVLTNVLTSNSSTLRFLNLGNNKSITSSGWQSFFMLGSEMKLTGLNLRRNCIDDAAIAAFAKWMDQSNQLRYLDLSSTKTATSKGWRVLFNTLKNQPVLGELNLLFVPIDTIGVVFLANTLPACLRKFHIGGHVSSNTTRWQSLSALLQREEMKLKTLSVIGIGEEALVGLITALSTNKTLELLDTYGDAWAMLPIFSDILCDTSSIDATFCSNHTLQKLDAYGSTIREPLRSYLETNRNPNKQQVARQKILQHHFSGDALDFSEEGNVVDTNFELFHEMGASELPHAIAWMGRGDDGLFLLHRLICCMPELLDLNSSIPGGKKRARGE